VDTTIGSNLAMDHPSSVPVNVNSVGLANPGDGPSKTKVRRVVVDPSVAASGAQASGSASKSVGGLPLPVTTPISCAVSSVTHTGAGPSITTTPVSPPFQPVLDLPPDITLNLLVEALYTRREVSTTVIAQDNRRQLFPGYASADRPNYMVTGNGSCHGASRCVRGHGT